MAQAMMTGSTLRLSFETGLAENGDPIMKSKTYSNVVEGATADQVYQVAQALGSLSTYPLLKVERTTVSEVAE